MLKQKLKNIWQLGVKELRGLFRDPLMLVLILYVFTLGIYSAATAKPDSISNASIAVVDEDGSQLSHHGCFLPADVPARKTDFPSADRPADGQRNVYIHRRDTE